MIEDIQSYNSQNIGNIVFKGVEEVIGQSGITSLYNYLNFRLTEQNLKTDKRPHPPLYAKDFCSLKKALEDLYGHLGGQGILLLSGRASFKYLTRGQELDDKFGDLAYRLLPTNARLKAGIGFLAQTILREWKIPTRVTEDNTGWYWWSGKYSAEGPGKDCDCLCLFLIGLLQEFTSWASGGRFYNIVELECMVTGSETCRIQVSKVPLE
jgi:hypothetical protein